MQQNTSKLLDLSEPVDLSKKVLEGAIPQRSYEQKVRFFAAALRANTPEGPRESTLPFFKGRKLSARTPDLSKVSLTALEKHAVLAAGLSKVVSAYRALTQDEQLRLQNLLATPGVGARATHVARVDNLAILSADPAIIEARLDEALAAEAAAKAEAEAAATEPKHPEGPGETPTPEPEPEQLPETDVVQEIITAADVGSVEAVLGAEGVTRYGVKIL